MTAETPLLRPHAEQLYAEELAALERADDRPRPPRWRLSPWAVTTYLLGGEADGTVITPKYVGKRRLVELAVATLATDRALLLLGVPGTAKTWMSEHLSEAVSGDSTLVVQGTAGTPEEALRYGWNYARLLADGPSRDALVPGPVFRVGAEDGGVVHEGGSSLSRAWRRSMMCRTAWTALGASFATASSINRRLPTYLGVIVVPSASPPSR